MLGRRPCQSPGRCTGRATVKAAVLRAVSLLLLLPMPEHFHESSTLATPSRFLCEPATAAFLWVASGPEKRQKIAAYKPVC